MGKGLFDGHRPARAINIIAPLTAAIVFFALGALFARTFLPQTPESSLPSLYPVREGSRGLINPLLTTTSSGKSPRFVPLENKINTQISKEINSGNASGVSVYFHDFNSGQWTGVNESEQYSAASLLKIPIMMAYLKTAETAPNILNDKLFYDGSFDDNSLENIKPTKEIQPRKEYTVSDLIRFAIQYSDNNANFLLVRHIGDAAVNDVFSDLKIPYPTSATDEYTLTPRQYSIFFRVLYSATYLSREMSEKALELLSYSDFPQGIAAGVPVDVVVAQKFGERAFPGENSGSNKELNNCGIIYHPQHPYFLCAMTKGGDFTKLSNVLRDISKIVWSEVENNYQK